MASPTVVTATESNATSDDASPYTVSRAAGVSGQLTIAVIQVDGNPTLTWPSGYTEFASIDRGGTFKVAVAYHQETGAEGTTFDITSDASEKWAAIVYSLSGAEDPATIAPEAQTVDGGTGTSATPDPPSLTLANGSKDYLFIAIAGNDGEEADDDTWGNTPPSSYTPSPPRQKTSAAGAAATTNVSLETAERALTTAGPQDPGTFGNDVAHTWVGITVAVAPPGPVPKSDSDAHTVTDTATLAATDTGTDAVTVADTSVVEAALTGSDAVSLSEETAAVVQTFDRSDSDSATVTEGTATLSATADPTDTVTVADTATLAADQTGTDTATVADTGTLSVDQTGTDSAVVAETGTMAASVAPTDAASLSDTASLTAEYSASDTVTLSELAVVEVMLVVSDASSLAEAVSEAVALTASDSATLSAESGSVEISGGGDTDVDATDAFTVTETAVLAMFTGAAMVSGIAVGASGGAVAGGGVAPTGARLTTIPGTVSGAGSGGEV